MEFNTQRSAFSLMELIIVMMIVAILAAVGTPRLFDSLKFHHVESATKRIVLDIEQARQRAVSTSTVQTVQFTPASHSYSLPGVPHPDHPSVAYSVELSAAPYFVSLSLVDFQGGTDLQLDHYGTADKDGQIIVSSGSHQRTITVTAATGEISVTP